MSLLFGTLCVAALLDETRPQRLRSGADDADDDDEEDLTALVAIFRDSRLAALLVPIAVIGICGSWLESVSPLYINGAGLLTDSGIGLLFAYAGAVGVVLQLPITRYARGHKPLGVILAAGAAQTLAFLLLLPLSLTLLVLAVTALSVARMLLGPLTSVLAVDLAPDHARATYQAAFGVTADLRDAAGPAVGTWLFSLSAVLPWVVAVPASLASALFLGLAVARLGGAAAQPATQPATEVSKH